MTTPIILIDAMNLIFRTGFAFQNLKNSDGKPTGVLYGVLKTIHDLREHVSKRIVIVYDHGVPVLGAERPRNWRDAALPSYKANRKSREGDRVVESIFSQLPLLHRVLTEMLGYPAVSVMGLEADDVIGILATQLWEDVLVFSTDKDFYQLLCPRVQVLVPQKDKGIFRRVTQKDVEAEYGIPISRWPEYLALGGDGADNIKPMRGMGPKTALRLIKSGVDLGKDSLRSQPRAFQDKYACAWEDIRKSYYAANLPRTWDDPRIRECLPLGRRTVMARSASQYWLDKSASQEAFVKFCSEHELITILALRRQLFDTGETVICAPTTTVTPPPTTKRELPRPLRRRPALV